MTGILANRTLEDMDKASLMHPYTMLSEHVRHGPKVILEGAGVHVADSTGKRLLDTLAGLWCVNVGYGRREIADAVYAQMNKLAFFHSFASMGTEPAIRLADRIVEMAPGMSKVFFANSGSEANDTAVKIVWAYHNLINKPSKKKIISHRRGYHGATMVAGSLTGLPTAHDSFDLPLPWVSHVEPPCYYWREDRAQSEEEFARQRATELEEHILHQGPETVAAFIGEPVMGSGGLIVPPPTYWRQVQDVLRKYDILLIADEVICGFGRLGRMFGCERLDIRPDIMTVAKGITSGYQPLSGTLVSAGIWDVLMTKKGAFGHGFTSSAHPVVAAAAMANLDIIERESLVAQAGRVGTYMLDQLRKRIMPHPLVGDVRGLGLLCGVDLVSEKEPRTPFARDLAVGRRVGARCYDRGMIIRSLMDGDVLALSPAFTFQESDVDAALAILLAALDDVASDLDGKA